MAQDEPKLSNACNFALDLQQGEGLEPDTFVKLVEKYGGVKVDETTLRFADDSQAQWLDGEKAWKIID